MFLLMLLSEFVHIGRAEKLLERGGGSNPRPLVLGQWGSFTFWKQYKKFSFTVVPEEIF